MIQLELFVDRKSEIDYLKDDVKNVRQSSDKVRKSLFARHGDLARKYAELSERMEILERNICRGNASRMSLQS
jgi:hypothetical protein